MLPINVWRHGRDEELPPRRLLRAGPLTAILEAGELRSIRLGETEVVNRIYVAVRDRNWETAPPVLSHLEIEEGKGFRVSFDVDCALREIRFEWKGTITGDGAGTIAFTMDGVAGSAFLRNRIGFCILHSDSCAGSPCVLLHSDDSQERSAFPKSISPHQPFLDLRGISHQVQPGAWADLRFEGEVFETEDQRNWTDASYKTYCTPLQLPYPVQVEKGATVSQSVTLSLKIEEGARLPAAPQARSGSRGGAAAGGRAAAGGGVAAGGRAAARFEIDRAASPQRLPAIGLCSASHGQGLSEREIARLRDLHLDHLRADLDPAAPGLQGALQRSLRQAGSVGARLHAAVHLSEAAEAELDALRQSLAGVPVPEVAMWLVFHKGEPCTTDPWVEAARRVLGPVAPSAKFASGTNANFTELNRGTPPGSVADCIVYPINPQVHAFDDTSIMETLSAQAATVDCARRIAGRRPVVVSPVTLKPRFNAVATGPVPSVPPGELPPQVDPRQMSLFTAAWTVGSVSSLALVGAEAVTFYETTGWRGVMETEAGPPVPQKFAALPGCVFPVYHVLADIGELRARAMRGGEVRGGEVLRGAAEHPRSLAGIVVRSGSLLRALIANLEPEPRTVIVTGISARRARVSLLDERTAEQACRDPEGFRRLGEATVPLRAGGLELGLLPFAVARIDWEE